MAWNFIRLSGLLSAGELFWTPANIIERTHWWDPSQEETIDTSGVHIVWSADNGTDFDTGLSRETVIQDNTNATGTVYAVSNINMFMVVKVTSGTFNTTDDIVGQSSGGIITTITSVTPGIVIDHSPVVGDEILEIPSSFAGAAIQAPSTGTRTSPTGLNMLESPEGQSYLEHRTFPTPVKTDINVFAYIEIDVINNIGDSVFSMDALSSPSAGFQREDWQFRAAPGATEFLGQLQSSDDPSDSSDELTGGPFTTGIFNARWKQGDEATVTPPVNRAYINGIKRAEFSFEEESKSGNHTYSYVAGSTTKTVNLVAHGLGTNALTYVSTSTRPQDVPVGYYYVTKISDDIYTIEGLDSNDGSGTASFDWLRYNSLNGRIAVSGEDNESKELRIFSNRGDTNEPAGGWGDFISTEDTSDDTRYKIEGYLAHKWEGDGVLNQLPFDHPHKYFPPVVGVASVPLWTPAQLSDTYDHWYDAANETSITEGIRVTYSGLASGTFITGETITQDTTLATGEVHSDDGVDEMTMINITGTFDSGSSHALSGSVSTATATDITAIITNKITCLDDLIGTEDLCQDTTGDEPTTGTRTLNTLNVIDCYDANLEHLEKTDFPLNSNGDHAIYGVFEVDDVDNVADSLWSFNAEGTDGDYQFESDNASNFLGKIESSNIPNGDVDLGAGNKNGPSVYGNVFDSTNEIIKAFVDGVMKGSNTGYTNGTDASLHISQHFRVMANRGEGNHLDGAFAEIVVTDDVTDAIRQNIEGYMAWKWGRVAQLESTHPYKILPPTV